MRIPSERRPARLWILLLVTVVAAGPLAAPPASATFPGTIEGIAFRSTRDGNPEIYRMEADGSNQIRLTNDPGTDARPAVSPDGTKIAFHSDRDGDFEIYTMNLVDGSGLVQVTNDPGTDILPAWSHDGSTIAFTSDRSGNFDIWTTDAPGNTETPVRNARLEQDGNPFQVTNDPAFDAEPTFRSPDGTYIIWTSNRDGNDELYWSRGDGSGFVRLTDDPATDFIADIGPDGRHIYWSSNRGGSFDIFRAPLTSFPIDANAVNITNHSLPMSEGKVAPDGTSVVSEGQEIGGTDFEIFTTNLTDPPSAPVQITFEGTNGEPAWVLAPPERVRHDRRISIRFNDGTGSRRQGLVVFGRLRVPGGFSDCRSRQPVNVQRRVNRRWVRVTKRTFTTNRRGRYAVEIFDQSSRYRAVAPRTEVTGDSGFPELCEKAFRSGRYQNRR